MDPIISSLHHVTATVNDAQEDLDFYGGLLGLRLVKKTVNFDNHNVYHFYYGDERGTPSTIMTTFPYRGWNVREGTRGAGQITVTSFSVPHGSLGYWERRLRDANVTARELEPRFGAGGLIVSDPSGLNIELLEGEDARAPWAGGGVDSGAAIRGIHGVTLSVRIAAPTLTFLNDVLGFRVVDEGPGRTRVATGGSAPGHFLDIVEAADAPAAINGLGTVHHVALAIADEDEQLRVRTELVRLGYSVTEVRDRQYFRSIYFREPGGVLYEIATVPPGFTVDEDVQSLGCGLMLPPWEEANRPSIERQLPEIVTP